MRRPGLGTAMGPSVGEDVGLNNPFLLVYSTGRGEVKWGDCVCWVHSSMRILMVADIHANWPALQAVAEPHDLCLFLGDLVEYCLEPSPCIDWVRQKAKYAVRGNHDHCAAQNVAITGRGGYKYLTSVTRLLTRERLRPED